MVLLGFLVMERVVSLGILAGLPLSVYGAHAAISPNASDTDVPKCNMANALRAHFRHAMSVAFVLAVS